jgi:hypothetical protein
MSEQRPSTSAPMSTGRAVALYTSLRFLLFLLSFAVLLALGLRGLLAAAAAVLVSSIVSLFVLKPQREALNAAARARMERKLAEREQAERGREQPGEPDGPR